MSGYGAILAIPVSLVCYFKAETIARRLVWLPKYTACPGCNFSLDNFRSDRCPECGLYLGEDFHAPPPPSQSESPSE